MIECMQDAGKEDYLRPSERIGLDWMDGLIKTCCLTTKQISMASETVVLYTSYLCNNKVLYK